MFKARALDRQQTEGTQLHTHVHSNVMRTHIRDNTVYINKDIQNTR